MVCDYRRINQLTKIDAHPLPDLEVILQQLGEMKYFSCVDLCSGYHQMGLDADAQELSAIATHIGLFEWTVTPFGLGGAPSAFSRNMAVMLSGMTYRNCMSFIDDVLIYSRTFEDHLEDLAEFFERLRKWLVSLKPTKCSFFAQSATYLGFTLSRDGLEPVAAKVQAINGIPAPTTLTQLRSFVQMVKFYRRFMKNLAVVAKPLTDLTRKERLPFKPWDKDSPEQRAFDAIKATLTSAPILRHPKPNLPFVLEIDASEDGLGAVLSQDFPVEDLDDLPDAQQSRRATARLPVYFASRKTKGGEPKYSPSHLEACAVLWALDYFRHYVLGRPCTVFTDHGPLTWIMKPAARENSQLARYALRLQEYSPWIDIQYKPGRVNSVPDATSRLPVDMDSDRKALDDIIIPTGYYVHAVRALTGSRESDFTEEKTTECPPEPASEADWNVKFEDLYADSGFVQAIIQAQHDNERMAGLVLFLEGKEGRMICQ